MPPLLVVLYTPQDALAILTKIVNSCGNASRLPDSPENTGTVPTPVSETPLENPPHDVTVNNETTPAGEETESFNSAFNEPDDLMDQSQSIADPLVLGDQPTCPTHLRVTDIDLSKADFGIGPRPQREKSSSQRKKNTKRLTRNAQSNAETAEPTYSGPCVRTQTRPTVPPNPSRCPANSFAALADLYSSDLSESVSDTGNTPVPHSEDNPSASDPQVPVSPALGSPVVRNTDKPNIGTDSADSEEEYTQFITESGNIAPDAPCPKGQSIPNHPYPVLDPSLSSDGEDSNAKRPGS